jgi:hypothetical protein
MRNNTIWLKWIGAKCIALYTLLLGMFKPTMRIGKTNIRAIKKTMEHQMVHMNTNSLSRIEFFNFNVKALACSKANELT